MPEFASNSKKCPNSSRALFLHIHLPHSKTMQCPFWKDPNERISDTQGDGQNVSSLAGYLNGGDNHSWIFANRVENGHFLTIGDKNGAKNMNYLEPKTDWRQPAVPHFHPGSPPAHFAHLLGTAWHWGRTNPANTCPAVSRALSYFIINM